MTRDEFEGHMDNVFIRGDGKQAQVIGFDEETQMVGIQYINGIRSAIPAKRYLYEVTVLASDLQDYNADRDFHTELGE